MTGVPYIGFGNDQLKDAPPIKEGDEILCPHCLGTHIIKTAMSDKGTMGIQYYNCGDKTYLAGLNERLIMGIKPAISGTLGDEDGE